MSMTMAVSVNTQGVTQQLRKLVVASVAVLALFAFAATPASDVVADEISSVAPDSVANFFATPNAEAGFWSGVAASLAIVTTGIAIAGCVAGGCAIGVAVAAVAGAVFAGVATYQYINSPTPWHCFTCW